MSSIENLNADYRNRKITWGLTEGDWVLGSTPSSTCMSRKIKQAISENGLLNMYFICFQFT